jgi:nitrogenase molybdenum-cofactor synthesis protein NifE
MHTALTLAERIPGLSTLVVGSAECTTYSRMVIRNPYGKQGELHWMYLLDGNEVVFGCQKGLSEAVLEMDREGAKVILLIMTCVPELIGEDMEMIVSELEPRIKARLIPIPAAHFNCNSYPSGFWRMLEGLAGLMKEPEAPAEKPIVNVLGFARQERSAPTATCLKYIQEQGIEIRFLSPGSTVEDFAAASDAVLNITLSPYCAPLAARMKKELGIPFVGLHSLYSAEEIDKAYGQIAESLELSWGDAFERERAELVHWESLLKDCSEGIDFAITDSSLDPVPLSAYLAGLGMEPLLLHMEGYYTENKPWVKKIKAAGYDPLVCHMVNRSADLPVLAELAPALLLGPAVENGGETACIRDLSRISGGVGYERSIQLLKGIHQVLLQK